MAYSILVVDDEALTLRTISRGLRDEGYEVAVALSGEEALKAFNEEKPDLVLLDVVLPGIDGSELDALYAAGADWLKNQPLAWPR